MAYTINKTDGTVVATITDGTVNTSTSLQLFGRSYSGFGEGLNENLVKLLENSASTSAPTAPLKGELWFDVSTNHLKVYDGTAWKVSGSAKSQSAAPTSASAGDFWHDSDDDQIYFHTGSTWQLLGPVFNKAQTLSGWQIDTLSDGSSTYTVSSMYAGGTRVCIASASTQFTPSPAISGFATIKPGLNLNSNISGAVFNGSTNAATYLDVSSTTNDGSNVAGGNFLRADANDITTGSLQINNDTGVIIGATAGSDAFEVSRSSGNVTLANTKEDGNISVTINDGGATVTPLAITGSSGAITLTGNVTIAGSLSVSGEYDQTSVNINTYDDAFIKLNNGNSEVDSGVIVETSDTDDARIFYDVSENYWAAGENQSYSQIIRLADAVADGDATKEKVLKTTAAGNLKVTTLTLGAVGNNIATSNAIGTDVGSDLLTAHANTSTASIGQVAESITRWGGHYKVDDGSNSLPGRRYIETTTPTSSDGEDGDMWFVREA